MSHWLDAAASSHDRVAITKALQALQPVTSRASAPSDALALYGRAQWLSGDSAGAERTRFLAGTVDDDLRDLFVRVFQRVEQTGLVELA